MALTDDQERELMRRYIDGEKTVVIAKKMRINRSTVIRALKRTGVYAPRWRPTDEQLREVYARHKSVVTVAEILEVSMSWVAVRLRRLGVEFHNRKPLSEETRRGILRAIDRGTKVADIMTEFGVSYATVWRVRTAKKAVEHAYNEAAE